MTVLTIRRQKKSTLHLAKARCRVTQYQKTGGDVGDNVPLFKR